TPDNDGQPRRPEPSRSSARVPQLGAPLGTAPGQVAGRGAALAPGLVRWEVGSRQSPCRWVRLLRVRWALRSETRLQPSQRLQAGYRGGHPAASDATRAATRRYVHGLTSWVRL